MENPSYSSAVMNGKRHLFLILIACLGLALSLAVSGCVSRSLVVSTLDYHPNGSLRSSVDAEGKRTSYAYDVLERIAKATYPGGRSLTYEYDGGGNIVEIRESKDRAHTFRYDLSDNLVEAEDADDRRLKYRYDRLGNIRTVVYPGGERIKYEHNANNSLTRVVDRAGATAYEYDSTGNIEKTVLPNGVTVLNQYDETGEVSGIKYVRTDGRAIIDFSYKLDSLGNIIETIATSGTESRSTLFEYDALARLRKTTASDGETQTYKYDGVGNRLSVLSESTYADVVRRDLDRAEYNERGLLLKTAKASYHYDRIGNLIAKEVDGETTRYQHDGQDRLSQIIYPDGSKSIYGYDVLGRRASKVDRDGRTTSFVYDGDNLVQEIGQDGQTLATYIYARGVDHPISMTRQDKTYYFVYDKLGSVMGLLDTGGQPVATYQYDAWGNIEAQTGKLVNPFRFNAREWDPDSGLYYFRARYYDPQVGRFITPDPFPGDLADPQSLNRYAFVQNNPINKIDPYGLYRSDDWYDRTSIMSPGYRMPHAGYVDRSWRKPVEMIRLAEEARAPQRLDRYDYELGRVLALQNARQLERMQPTLSNGLEFLAWQAISIGAGNLVGYVFPGLRDHVNLTSAVNSAAGFGMNLGPDYVRVNPHGFYGLAEAMARTAIVSRPVGREDIEFQLGNIYMHMITHPRGGLEDLYASYTALDSINESTIKDQIRREARNRPSIFKKPGDDDDHSSPGGFFWPPGFDDDDDDGGGGSGVGGVLLDEAAQVNTGLSRITGAYYDPDLGQLILTGIANNEKAKRSLPKMDMDHLAVAMRAVFSGQAPGVSIDRPSARSTGGALPASGTQMPTRYLGGTENTLFGAIMFQADKLLKNLSLGKDNVSGEEVDSEVSGFRNELDLSLERRGSQVWHRMWFLIDDMSLDMPVRESADRGALAFSRANLKVKTEYLNQGDNPGADPAAEEFAQHFSANYDDLAAEHPILERLRELAKIAAIAKYLKDSGKPVDMAFVANYQPVVVPTPAQTPGITVSKSRNLGSVIQTSSLFGGVDFDFEYRAVSDNGEAGTLRSAAQKARPDKTSFVWDFDIQGTRQSAIAFQVAGQGQGSVEQVDLKAPKRGKLRLELARRYRPLSSMATFGWGWELIVPYELFSFDAQDGTFFLLDRAAGGSHKYRLAADGRAYYRVNKETEKREGNGTSVEFSLDPADSIESDPNGHRWKSPEGITYGFNRQGKLTLIDNGSGSRINYDYRDERVVRISDSRGNAFDLKYDGKGHVSRAIDKRGESIEYSYNGDGELVEVVSDKRGLIDSYAYDANRQIAEASVGTQKQSTGGKKETVLDVGAIKVKRSFDAKSRLVGERDSLGNSIDYQYDNEDRITGVSTNDQQTWEFGYDKQGSDVLIIDPLGNRIKFERDEQNNVVRAVNARGKVTELAYTPDGRIKEIKEGTAGRVARYTYDNDGRLDTVANAGGQVASFVYGDDGRSVTIRDALGEEYTQKLDSSGRLIQLTNAESQSLILGYDSNGSLTKVDDAGRLTEYEYDKKGDIIKTTDAAGASTRFDYDSRRRLVAVTDALQNVTRYTHDNEGNLVSVTDANDHVIGRQYDKYNRVSRVTLPTSVRELQQKKRGSGAVYFLLPLFVLIFGGFLTLRMMGRTN